MTIIKPKNPLLLPRRRILQGVAALSAARVLTEPALGQLQGAAPNPTAPSQAAAAGYKNLTFSDDFNSLSTVDVKNTRARGYNWYVNNGWPNSGTNLNTYPPTAASCFSQSGTLLNCGPSVPTGGANYGNAGLLLATACVDPNNSSHYIGRVFSGGFYAETSLAMQYNASSPSPPCPAFWLLPVEVGTSKSVFTYTEIDVMEHANLGVTNNINFNAYQWLFPGGVQTATGINDVVDTTPHLNSTLLNQNIWGVLNVPMAQNAGRGYLEYYLNNNRILAITYTATGFPSPTYGGMLMGGLSDIDGWHYYLIFGWQNTGTIAIDWCRVWQL